MLPLATLTLPFERPRLRLAAPAVVDAAPAVRPDTAPPVASAEQVRVAEAAVGLPEAGRTAGPAASTTADVVSPRIAAAQPASKPAPLAAVPEASTPLVGSAAPAAQAPVTRPVATRIVQPKFPSFAQRAAGRIEASFTIASDGSVADIRLVEGEAGSAFARAAERALKQWRFDPATVPAGETARYTQTFVFAPRAGAAGAGHHDECFKPTGSLVCRDPEDSTADLTYTPRR
jgi:protein TonB